VAHIVCLDLGSIDLTSLPPDIGVCRDLRDNFRQYVPPELSQCMKLETLLSSGHRIAYRSQIQAMIELRQLNQCLRNAPAFCWSQPNASFTIVMRSLFAQHEAMQPNFPKCTGNETENRMRTIGYGCASPFVSRTLRPEVPIVSDFLSQGAPDRRENNHRKVCPTAVYPAR
jgi:hypothetical protein